MAILNNNPLIGSGGQQGYSINNSLRFRSSASAYLNRTQTTTTNSVKCTFSGWVKRGALGTTQVILSGFTGNDADTYIYFDTTNKIRFYSRITNVNGAAAEWFGESAAVYRDPSAWYHIVVVIDTSTSKATNNDYYTVYVNNIAQTFTTVAGANLVSAATVQNRNTNWNVNGTSSQAGAHRTANYLDGYLADVNFIDGSAKTPSDFGETDTTTGVWKPKAYTGTYGTNGFYLKFSDIATTSGSNAGLGKDFSGNTNYWTTNNISVTAGTTYDAMTDSPTNTSATVANYAVLNPLTLRSGTGTVSVTTSNANLTWNFQTSGASPQNYMVSGTIGMSSGKWYWEMTPTTITATTGLNIGIGANPYSSTNFWATDGNSTEYFYVSNSGNKGNNGSSVAYGSSYTVNDVIGVALDMDAGTLTFYKNNVSQGTAFTGLTGTYFPFIACPSSAATDVVQVNFGQRPFTYTPPTGFNRLNTYNLPDSTIVKGNSYFDSTLYTGTGSSQSIVNAGGFSPDFVWVKNRSHNDADPYYGVHLLFNTNAGVGNRLMSQSTASEAFSSQSLTAFNSNGFSIGTDNAINYSGDAYVGWQWRGSDNSAVTNTQGSITSTVSVNTTAGFSVVTYTGNGSTGATFGHGLGVAPKMVIIKKRSTGTAGNWITYHTSTGINQYLYLNSTAASATATPTWGVSATLITLQQSFNDYNTSTAPYVAYCWAEIAGYSKFGSYTGNGSADGPMVYCNFAPKWIMFKKTTTGTGNSNWWIYDSVRNTFNVATYGLLPNLSNAEQTNTTLDILSNGFKLRSSNGEFNDSGQTFIFAAFASNPFKNSNAV